MTTQTKEQQLFAVIKAYGSMVIAYSGGVDSTLLAAATERCLAKDKFMLVNINSVFTATLENQFVTWAENSGMPLQIIKMKPLDDPIVRSNTPERCYHCKKIIMGKMLEVAEQLNFAVVADGTNLDDFDDYRPGLKATAELEIKHPFVEAGFTKQDIRDLSRHYGLPNWNEPAAACLASRIPHHIPLDEQTLKIVDEAETFLHKLGFPGCRVRIIDSNAKLELRGEEQLLQAIKQRTVIIEKLQASGLKEVMLDLVGYRQGAMNRN
jgi:pyridinium-3,5-biscarboxylic acid mononucleotide sulfurtransferase